MRKNIDEIEKKHENACCRGKIYQRTWYHSLNGRVCHICICLARSARFLSPFSNVSSMMIYVIPQENHIFAKAKTFLWSMEITAGEAFNVSFFLIITTLLQDLPCVTACIFISKERITEKTCFYVLNCFMIFISVDTNHM